VEQHYRLRTLQEYAELEGALLQLDLITDVEALERMLNTGARLYGDDTGACLRDLGIVVGGLDTNAIIPNRIGAGHPLEQYYVGYSNFLPNEGTTAFGNNLNPGGDNQVRHFMAGAAGSSGRGLFAENYLLSNEDADEDLALYRQAFAFVDYLDDNPLSSAGSWIRENLTAK
jgi:hypothetical protein